MQEILLSENGKFYKITVSYTGKVIARAEISEDDYINSFVLNAWNNWDNNYNSYLGATNNDMEDIGKMCEDYGERDKDGEQIEFGRIDMFLDDLTLEEKRYLLSRFEARGLIGIIGEGFLDVTN